MLVLVSLFCTLTKKNIFVSARVCPVSERSEQLDQYFLIFSDLLTLI